MLELSGSQIKVLRLGLQSAFVGADALNVFLREDLDKHLNFYSEAEDPFPIAAFKLIEGAQAEGWVDELVTKAYKARPRNRDIADIAKALGVTIDVGKLEPAGLVQGASPLWHSLNPYRGLLALREQDANFLFGRDDDIARFIATLAKNPAKLFLALGASGVGKSSLIFAGVFAALDRQSLRGGTPWPERLAQSRTWPRLTLTPGQEPLRSLAGAFVRQWLDPREAKFREETNSWRELFLKGDKIDGLIEALDSSFLKEKGDKPSRYLVYIDQGEELYTRGGRVPNQDGTQKETQAQKEARRFSELLADAASHPRLVAIMSARSDFLGRLQADAPLHAVKQQIDIAPLSPEGLSEVVRRPAAALDVTFERGLDDDLIEATREQAGALPLLSDTLDILWKEMQERGDGTLRWSRPLKEGVDVAMKLGERADGFVKAHHDQEALVRRLFCLRLAYVPLQGAATRRTAFLEELTDPERALVAELAGAEQRILVTGEREGKPTAEIAHEALFTAWQTLGNWISARRDFYAWVTQIETDRQDYEKQGELLTGRPLERAKSFLETDGEDVPAADRAFVQASIKADEEIKRKAQERERQILVRTQIGAAIALILALIAGGIGWWALKEKAVAENHRVEADKRKAEAEERLLLARNTTSSLVTLITDDLRNVQGIQTRTLTRLLDAAEASFDKLANVLKDDRSFLADRAKMMSGFGEAYLKNGDFQKSVDANEQSRQILQSLLEQEPKRIEWRRGVANEFDEIGVALRSQVKYEDSLKKFNAALELRNAIAQELPGDWATYRDLAASHYNLGEYYLPRDRPDEALDEQKKALSNVEHALELAKSDNRLSDERRHTIVNDLNRQLARVYVSLSTVYERLKDETKRKDTLLLALSIRRDLYAANKDNADDTRLLAWAYQFIGAMEYDEENWQDAKNYLEESLRLRNDLVARNPLDARAQSELAWSNHLYGNALRGLRQFEEAAHYLKEAAEIRHRLYIVSDNDSKVKIGKDYALGMENLGDLENSMGKPAALTSFREAARMLEELVKRPQTPELYLSLLAGIDIKIGRYLGKTGDTEGALKLFDESCELEQVLHEKSPNNVDFHFQLAKSHCLAADMLAARSLNDRARGRYQMCEQISREIVKLKPNFDAARRKLEEVEKTLAALPPAPSMPTQPN